MTQNNKKRKQEIVIPAGSDAHHEGGNIGSVLYTEMNEVNCKLISLARNVKLADHQYFVNNYAMVDEFIGNIQQFLEELIYHRRKVSFREVNSDMLFHIYQFLDTKTVVDCCGLISKFWRESLKGLKLKVQPNNIDKLLNSSIIKKVSKLKITTRATIDTFKSLSNCRDLDNLKSLDLCYNDLDDISAGYLKDCHMPNLTELKHIESLKENTAKDLFHSKFMSNIKSLDISHCINKVSNNFYESFDSESTYMNQLTRLKIVNNNIQTGKRIDLLLKDKQNLEQLTIHYYQLTLFPNIFTNGDNLNLTFLDISWCLLRNQDLVNILISPKLPNLKTLKARWLNYENDWTSIEDIDITVSYFPPNSQSSITHLDISGVKLESFPSILEHCPKLKKLEISPDIETLSEETKRSYINMMKCHTLSSLEYLDVECCYPEIFEIIFTNPIYSNLTELIAQDCQEETLYNSELIFNCTTLKRLRKLNIKNLETNKAISKEQLITNPTFANLQILMFRKN